MASDLAPRWVHAANDALHTFHCHEHIDDSDWKEEKKRRKKKKQQKDRKELNERKRSTIWWHSFQQEPACGWDKRLISNPCNSESTTNPHSRIMYSSNSRSTWGLCTGNGTGTWNESAVRNGWFVGILTICKLKRVSAFLETRRRGEANKKKRESATIYKGWHQSFFLLSCLTW